ncbi:carboxypeptidase-like regulatory domain-containing protein [Rhodocytophaga rosea]|uniref:Carboxypeptidase-like regulatory domain-containing protein n=1 Tax=Rhodocytophaga rosea TaxID=2704465 RepID=A0A6C0GJH8_9BACT|nr:carboxypeptidase-like regulatory domain-containing protein [Rhodocytophaga rosea]QHT67843.1 carboxypeptidase-like regulatory domain-containing protein [Rhodocytophaga rosea]
MQSISNTSRYTIVILFLIVGFVSLLGIQRSQAQGSAHIIQFSGIIIGGEDSEPVGGAHIYVPKAGRGTTTNPYGFFALPVMVGDSLLISAVGYKKQYYKVPLKYEKGFSVVIELLTDTTMLPVVEVYPYPTEELFKEAFLALNLPDEKAQAAMRKNLNQQLMQEMALNAGPSGSESFRYYSNQQSNMMYNRNFAPTLQFLNPFAWANFIKQVKRGDFKKKK